MQDKIRLILFLVCLWGVSGCSQPGIFIKQFDSNEHFTPSSWETILVLPFSGEKKHRLTSPEWLAFYLQKQNRYSIVTPTYAEIEIISKGMSFPENGFSIEQARQAAQLLEVDAVLIGNVETEKRSQSPVKISLQLIDVKTGEQIVSHTIG